MHFLPSLDPGGMENGVVNIVNGLGPRFESSICCLEASGSLHERISNPDVRVFVMNKQPGVKPGLFFSLAKLMKQEKIDIVHTHNHLTIVYGVPAALMAPVPVVIHGEHGTPDPYNFKGKVMYHLYYHFLDLLLVVSKPLGEEIELKRGVSGKKIRVIPNGVDTRVFNEQPKEVSLLKKWNLDGDDIVIGSVGRVEPVKNYLSLLEIIYQLKNRGFKVKGLLVGDGSDMVNIKAKIEEYGLQDHFTLVGESDKIPEMLSLMDIFLLPSLSEGMSNSILEAMSCGKPIVATSAGNNSELVQDGINGFLLEQPDTDAFVKSVLMIVKDAELRKRMGQSSRAIVEQDFSLTGMVRNYEEVYIKLFTNKNV